MINVEEVLTEHMARIKKEYNLPDIMDDEETVVTLSDDDQIFYICYKLNYWLGQNVLYKVFKYFQELSDYLERVNPDFDKLDPSCQIVMTIAKYYVRGCLRVKEVYHI